MGLFFWFLTYLIDYKHVKPLGFVWLRSPYLPSTPASVQRGAEKRFRVKVSSAFPGPEGAPPNLKHDNLANLQ